MNVLLALMACIHELDGDAWTVGGEPVTTITVLPSAETATKCPSA
jgi:hypothetical protein